MAKQTTVRLVCDMDGGDAQETVRFGLDGREYEIDLGEVRVKEIRDALAPFVAAGRKISGGPGRRPGSSSPQVVSSGNRPAFALSRPDKEQNTAIRTWARAQGMKLSDRGRIPAEVLEAYNANGGRAGQAIDNLHAIRTLEPSQEAVPEIVALLEPTGPLGGSEAPEEPSKPKPSDVKPRAPRKAAAKAAPKAATAPAPEAADAEIIAWHQAKGLKIPANGKPNPVMRKRYRDANSA